MPNWLPSLRPFGRIPDLLPVLWEWWSCGARNGRVFADVADLVIRLQ
jgi:hypothetical protein